ncbi:MAG: hypothetical protein K2J04_11885 [Lachnospiraceae bacterium]|nr:hypothetical protein [Lachnospiraceae bacterium]
MSIMQEKAYEMIKRLPDDKLYYIVRLLEGLEGLVPSAKNDDSMTVERKAYEDLQQFRRCCDVDIDYKEELAQALEEKCASIN